MKWKSRIGFTLLTYFEHGAVRAFDALVTLLLIKFLTVDSFSAFSVYQSWVAVFMLIFPALENALYRGYFQIKSSGELSRLVALLRAYNFFRVILALILCLACSILHMDPLSWPARMAGLSLAFALPLSHALYSCYREVLRFELHQRPIGVVTIAQKATLAAMIYIIAIIAGGRVSLIGAGGTLVLFGFYFIWRRVTIHVLNSQNIIDWHTPLPSLSNLISTAYDVLKKSVLWMHINGSISAAVQTLDLLLLSRYGYENKQIALYAIALKGANFFQSALIPLGQVALVKISRTEINDVSKKNLLKVTMWASLGFAVIALGLFFSGFYMAEPIVGFLAKGRFSTEELGINITIFKWLLAGVCLYSVTFVPGAYISAVGNIRLLSLSVFIPWFLMAFICYGFASKIGLLQLAKMNIVVYGSLVVGHFFVVFSDYFTARNSLGLNSRSV